MSPPLFLFQPFERGEAMPQTNRIAVTGRAVLRDAAGDTILLSPSDIDWEVVSSAKLKKGVETGYGARYVAGDRAVTWTLTECPPGVVRHQATYADGVEVVEDFALALCEPQSSQTETAA